MLRYRLNIKDNQDIEIIEKLCKDINVSIPIAKILFNRGITDFNKAKNFFCPNLKNLYNPFLMKGMNEAVNILLDKIEKNENILIYGDYDTDGITSVAMFYLFLKENFKNNVYTYIPNRFKEGYGFSKNGVDYAQQNNCTLIITLDCGVTSIEEVKYANEKNIDIIITDHHEPKEILPKAFCILDPKQKECEYPFKELSGCGVGFKFIQAVSEKKKIEKKRYYKYLDFVAVSIAGDMVSVMNENRILLYYGLQKLNRNPNTGFIPFIDKIGHRNIKTSDIVFNISPKINSSGRIDCPKKSLNILIEEDLKKARILMYEIDKNNNDRKLIDNEMVEEAIEMILCGIEQNNFTTVLYNENWHKGVLGIVASKLIDKYYRPTIVFCKAEDGFLSGSARTIEGVDILDLIGKSGEYILKFGGHKSAAGLIIKEENFPHFKNKFENEARKIIMKKDLSPFINIDAKINLKEINDRLINTLERMEPFGPDNMTPIFYTEDLKNPKEFFLMGKQKEHIKFMINEYVAIGFSQKDKYNSNNKNINIAYSLDRKKFMNQNEIIINIRDIK